MALLRAINIAGKGTISMAGLRDSANQMGLKNVRTIGQAGNLIFETAKPASTIERQLESRIAQQFTAKTAVIVRKASELVAIVRQNPFKIEAAKDPSHLLVVFLKEEAGSAREAALRSVIKGHERVALRRSVLYAVYPDGIGRSKLTAALIDRQLGTQGTGRNWNTVLKLLSATDSKTLDEL